MWSWILCGVGLYGAYLSGNKARSCWLVYVFCELLWGIYGMVTGQYGFVVSAVIFSAIFIRNYLKWSEDRFSTEAISESCLIGSGS